MSTIKDLTGKRFGRLIVLSRSENDKHGHSRWECKCECGKIRVINSGSLLSIKTKSCGCLRDEKVISRRTTHGHSLKGKIHPLFLNWIAMRQRCNNDKNKAYKDYGGRGIKVCERWNEFENFLEDMGEKPSNLHSIDRIDVNGNYEPSNCRWATTIEQGRNKRMTSRNISGYTGVFWVADKNKWKSTLSNKHLGYFDNKEDAIDARKEAELKFWSS